LDNIQNKEEAERLVNQGIQYHDEGLYQQAITLYNQALEFDQDNLLALAEKAFSLFEAGELEESILCCKLAIEKHPGDKLLRMVYSNYGNALDESQKPDSAIIIYDQGLALFPDSYLLHFNKAITLISQEKYPEALLCAQKSVTLNPFHPGSHNAISMIAETQNLRIPCLLASFMFLVLEPEGERATDNLATIRYILNSYVEVTGKKSVTVNVTPEMLTDTNEYGQRIENCFSSVELMLAIDVSLDQEKKYAKQTEVERFMRKFQTMCTVLELSRDDNSGFFWDYYVPFFTELFDKQLTETFAYIAFASTDEDHVWEWLTAHPDEIKAFYEWTDGFQWGVE
jgi:tetratricopeptide (TPR) repeat protein